MFVTVTERFYRLDNVFSDELFHSLTSVFDRDTANWLKQYDGNSAFPRLQFCPDESAETTALYNQLCDQIRVELTPVIEFAESVTESKLYQNNPQLWRDPDGYINTIHDGDVSPNHFVNVQIYLSQGNENMGTYCYDQDAWHTVPFRPNCGYMMLYPTRTPHGMKNHVVDKRYSLYQGFRATEIPSDIW
jgi:hypothetical protein